MNMIPRIDAADAEPYEQTSSRRGSRRWGRAIGVLVPAAVVGAGLTLASREPAPEPAPPPPTVTVAQPITRRIMLWDDHVGRFEASKTVEVRPRVAGQIAGVHFTDGQVVHAGQLLFTIDPRPFAAALAEAQAGLASAESDLALARADLSRAQSLIADQAVSRSEVDRLQARLRASEAAVAAARARVQTRGLELDFTRVRAPIGGRVSDRRVDEGNLVTAGDGATGVPLTTINALDPIHFSFEASEALYLKAKRAPDGGGQPAEIRLQDEADYRWKGKLDFTDNAIDPRTGSIRGRAVLRNPELFLTPGMFGNMRLSAGQVEALLVPDAAVRTDQARKIVLTVSRDGMVAAKPVQTGPLVGGLRVIRSGLSASDRIVVAGTQLAAPGSRVQVRPGAIQSTRIEPALPPSTPLAAQATLRP